MGKKKDKKKQANSDVDLAAEVKRLRKENAFLRKRLEKIGDLATDLPEADDQVVGDGSELEALDDDVDEEIDAPEDESSPVATH